MFQLDGKKIRIDLDLTVGEGVDAITYPAASLQNAATRTSIGIVEVTDPVRPDDRRYWVSVNEDGSYTSVLKETALADEIAALILQIDADADAIYTAELGNRATEYAEAEAQARAYVAAGYSGDVPSYVQAWADATGNTAQWAADSIVAKADIWSAVQAELRAERLSKKEAARNAEDFDALDTLRTEWLAFVAAIRKKLGLDA